MGTLRQRDELYLVAPEQVLRKGMMVAVPKENSQLRDFRNGTTEIGLGNVEW